MVGKPHPIAKNVKPLINILKRDNIKIPKKSGAVQTAFFYNYFSRKSIKTLTS